MGGFKFSRLIWKRGQTGAETVRYLRVITEIFYRKYISSAHNTDESYAADRFPRSTSDTIKPSVRFYRNGNDNGQMKPVWKLFSLQTFPRSAIEFNLCTATFLDRPIIGSKDFPRPQKIWARDLIKADRDSFVFLTLYTVIERSLLKITVFIGSFDVPALDTIAELVTSKQVKRYVENYVRGMETNSSARLFSRMEGFVYFVSSPGNHR